jgi:EF hand
MSAKTLLIATVALATTALTALPSVAAPSQPGPPAQAGQASQPGPAGKMPLRATIMFALIDRNGDGSIQKEELDVVRDAIFASLDTNSDGQLSKDELGAIGPMFGPGRGPGPDGHDGMHRHHDRGGQWQGQNDDRRGPPHDRQGQMGPRGPQHDQQGRNDDRRGPPHDQQGRNDDRRGPPHDQMGYRGGPNGDRAGKGRQNFASLDTNGDGVISKDEFAAKKLPLPGIGPQQPPQSQQ